ncbi:Hypothetical protein PHPALM_6058 [Phytophthora palmivora]|uniref:Uncharacterized protein n=1 Tax=Phytophthora palmivora TaxID=4796 RepID=A0A2P4YG45_9STRA|nr:Hypothetical protein PHPALM_6058 [Phytophthora palmivora]
MSNKSIHNPRRFFDAARQLDKPWFQFDPNHFTPKEFEEFLISKQGELKTTALGGYRSAMLYKYRRHSMAVPPKIGEPMETFFLG